MWTTIIDRLNEIFSPDAIAAYLALRLPNVIVAALTVLAFLGLWRVIKRTLRFVLKRTHLDETAQSFLETVLKYVVMTIGLVSALDQIGINTGSVLASLGVLGLTIGFAAQDTLSNLISGIFIFWDRPFVIGDLVDIGGNYGRVTDITMRSTRVVTVDGKMLAVPNREIVNSTVASYTNFPHLRLDVALTIGVDESIDRVRGLLLGIVDGDERYLSDPAPSVVLTNVGDYNLEVAFRVWIDDERQHIPLRFELREKMYTTLYSAGVDMPLERLEVNVKRETSAA